MEQKLIIDFEMCKIPAKVRKKGDRYLFSEIIQIGAAVLDEDNHISDQFGIYVKPQLGEIDDEISELTGITNEMVENTPYLPDALNRMCQWIGQRKFHVLSWSDTDYFQLLNEMRSKKIRNRNIERLFENWSDLQKSFSDMVGLNYILSLDRAIEASAVDPVGRLHDGLDDAINTAKIVAKVQKNMDYQLTYQQIEEEEEVEHLNASLGNFFSADILSQFYLAEDDIEEEEEVTTDVDPYREYRRLLFETDRETGDCWELYRYHQKISKT